MSRRDDPVPKPEDWLRVQPHIRQLYVVDQKPLKDVSRILEEKYGFSATQRMYKSRIQAWKYDKKFKEAEWRQIIAMWKRRREDEGKESVFKVRGRTINSAKIKKFLKRKKIEELDFLSSGMDSEPMSDIQCFTPVGSPPPNTSLDSASITSDADLEPSSVSDQSRHNSFTWIGPQDHEVGAPGPSVLGHTQSALPTHTIRQAQLASLPPLEPYRHIPDQNIPLMLRSGSESSASSSRVVYGVEGMALRSLTPDSVMLEEKDDLILCNLMMARHPPSLAGEAGESGFHSQQQALSPLETVPVSIHDADIVLCHSRLLSRSSQNLYVKSEDALASQWLSRLFQASIFHNQNRPDLAERNKAAAEDIFYTMVKSQNPYLLPGLAILSGIMTSHHQWPLVTSFLSRCCRIAEHSLGTEHPITVAFEHIRGVCAGQRSERITAEHLWRAIITFELAWSPDHPNTIVLKHLRAWQTLCNGDAASAEQQFRILLPIAERVMGSSNYVTTWIMRSLSRACKDQGNLQGAIALMSDAVLRQRRSLGPFHPDRMEGLRRLAEMNEQVGDLMAAERYFNEALWGQVKMLGVNHGLTIGTLNQLSNTMLQRGRVEEEAQLQQQIDRLLQEEKRRRFLTPAEAY